MNRDDGRATTGRRPGELPPETLSGMTSDSWREAVVDCPAGEVAGLLALVESGLFDQYVSYERLGTRYFAGDARFEVLMDRDSIRCRAEGRTQRIGFAGRPLRTLGDLVTAALDGGRAYGYLTFELAGLIHGAVAPAPTGPPLAHVIVPEVEVVWSPDRPGQATVSGRDPARIELVRRCLAAATPVSLPEPEPVQLTSGAGRETYESLVGGVLAAIEGGRLRKAIVSRRLDVPFAVDLPRTYAVGLSRNTPARSFLLQLGDRRSAGFSPETVVEVGADGSVSTQPLAGTRPLGADPARNRALRQELEWDVKECYEHVISARLAVDEMHTVCDPATVAVKGLLSVLERGTVQHLASRVTGQLREGLDAWDAAAALFPAVTASGIPKEAALSLISGAEPDEREMYAGAVCLIGADGTFDSALVLRSAYQNRAGDTWLRAGAGIVADSRPELEYDETTHKLASIARCLVAADPAHRTPADPREVRTMDQQDTAPETGSPTDVRAALTRALGGLGIDDEEVRDDATLHGVLELDSTETVQVALELTRHLGVRISLSGGEDPPVAVLVDQVVRQYREAAGSAEAEQAGAAR